MSFLMTLFATLGAFAVLLGGLAIGRLIGHASARSTGAPCSGCGGCAAGDGSSADGAP